MPPLIYGKPMSSTLSTKTPIFILAALRGKVTDNAVSGCSARKCLTYPRAYEERKVRHAAVVEGF